MRVNFHYIFSSIGARGFHVSGKNFVQAQAGARVKHMAQIQSMGLEVVDRAVRSKYPF